MGVASGPQGVAVVEVRRHAPWRAVCLELFCRRGVAMPHGSISRATWVWMARHAPAGRQQPPWGMAAAAACAPRFPTPPSHHEPPQINCETDFVPRNEAFKTLVQQAAAAATQVPAGAAADGELGVADVLGAATPQGSRCVHRKWDGLTALASEPMGRGRGSRGDGAGEGREGILARRGALGQRGCGGAWSTSLIPSRKHRRLPRRPAAAWRTR